MQLRCHNPLFASIVWSRVISRNISWSPVEISSTETVLRYATKDEIQNTFHDVAADQSTLYYTSLPNDGELENKLEHFDFTEALHPMLILAIIFAEPPVDDHPHIIVQMQSGWHGSHS
ncbi:hypothetical protein EDD16DRAFT_177963 [Pisolithus croceorrhizus]|nr:hypothetical protein EV401DRAFT_1282093 [Pisolithus croceorrhizus]KAI6128205.1 hypothetical protein EDD16DRAFT_177963 [Pisolithus croceorrhizus]KAI6165253.1 hypothetical protein EDD17DRAFT_276193 [Pisolithus thermaeus]